MNILSKAIFLSAVVFANVCVAAPVHIIKNLAVTRETLTTSFDAQSPQLGIDPYAVAAEQQLGINVGDQLLLDITVTPGTLSLGTDWSGDSLYQTFDTTITGTISFNNLTLFQFSGAQPFQYNPNSSLLSAHWDTFGSGPNSFSAAQGLPSGLRDGERQNYFNATLPGVNQSGAFVLDWVNWESFAITYISDYDGRTNSCAGAGFDCRPSSRYTLAANAVNEVPIPASLWLFGSAFLGLVKLRKKA